MDDLLLAASLRASRGQRMHVRGAATLFPACPRSLAAFTYPSKAPTARTGVKSISSARERHVQKGATRANPFRPFKCSSSAQHTQFS